MSITSFVTPHVSHKKTEKEWVIVDAEALVLGRLASEVAKIIRGKHKPTYSPHVDGGDNVIIINAEKIRLTGKKMSDREYVSHTGYPGGQRFQTPKMLMAKNPAKILEMAVKGMLPKNRLGRRLFTHLYVYAGSEHPHSAQSPKAIDIKI
ncbi:MAG TPA: 50S ribosomal protein L13 [Catalimonadaceae bacterium]|nr:50S ribosomal protein L13 [Catalimonadaceae bacterium]